MFSENPGYHGEVSEFCINYLSRMKYVNGIAINSWSSEDARKIFENTDKVFAGTKYKNSYSFEIDWLIFTESTITVVEIGNRGESEDKKSGKKLEEDKEPGKKTEKQVKRVIKNKFDQIIKDDIIINHLLDATATSTGYVFYLVVFPDIPFEQVERRLQVPFHRTSLENLVKALVYFAFLLHENRPISIDF